MFQCSRNIFWKRLAVSVCPLMISFGLGEGNVVQTSPSQIPSEWKTISMECETTIAFSEMYWYVQQAAEGPKLLIVASDRGEHEGRFKAVGRSSEKSGSLTISSLRLTDTGTYYCAVHTQCQRAPETVQKLSCVQVASFKVTELIGALLCERW